MLLYQLINIRKKLNEISKYEGIEFAYSVFKNKQIIDKKLNDVEFIKNISPEIMEYENKRTEFCEKHSKKDSNGEPIIDNDLYTIADIESFKKDMNELNTKYEPFLKKREEQINLFNTKMNEEVECEFFKININELPPDFKTANDLEDISFMIK